VVTIDDFLAFRKTTMKPYYAGAASDGGYWTAFLEKVWAKINGNYETIISGDSAETFTFLSGCPTT
jgi:hypothetical protein